MPLVIRLTTSLVQSNIRRIPMDERFWSATDNFSEVTHSPRSTFNSTNAPPTISTSPAGYRVSAEAVVAMWMVIFNIGSFANAGALVVLVRVRRQFSSSVHTLIVNQCVADLYTCATGVITILVMLIHGFKYNGNRIIDGAICVLFEDETLTALLKSISILLSNITTITTVSRFSKHAICVIFEGITLTAFGVIAAKLGLIVITLERYFKIVHAIAHRKHYRNWMTKVGLALPWIGATCLVLLPAFGTTRIVNGRCLFFYAWPNKTMTFVSLHVLSSIRLCKCNTTCWDFSY